MLMFDKKRELTEEENYKYKIKCMKHMSELACALTFMDRLEDNENYDCFGYTNNPETINEDFKFMVHNQLHHIIRDLYERAK